jgi:hypothetical protein
MVLLGLRLPSHSISIKRKNLKNIKLRVDSRSASFNLVVSDTTRVQCRLNLSNPTVQLTLSSNFDFDMPDSRYYAWGMGQIDSLTGLSWNNGQVTRAR